MSSDMSAPATPRRPAGTGETTPSGAFFGPGPSARPILRWVGTGLTAIAAGYFFLHVAENTSELTSLDWDVPGMATVAAAFGLYAAMLAAFPIAWFLLLRGTKERPRFLDVVAVAMISQFAKYVPGNIAQHIGRIALAHACGIDTSRVVVTMIVETGWVILAGATIGAMTILAGAPAMLGNTHALPEIWQLAIAGIAGALAPLAGARLLGRWKPGPLRRLLGSGSVDLPPTGILVCCFAIYTGIYLLMGAILYLLAHNVFGLAHADYWLMSGIFALAWMAGFLVPGAPGGLGVREAVLVATLGPLFGEAAAVAIALLLRVISTLGDGAGFVFGIVVRHISRRAGREAAPARVSAPAD